MRKNNFIALFYAIKWSSLVDHLKARQKLSGYQMVCGFLIQVLPKIDHSITGLFGYWMFTVYASKQTMSFRFYKILPIFTNSKTHIAQTKVILCEFCLIFCPDEGSNIVSKMSQNFTEFQKKISL
jgi:Pyruvate/2-oxoacid:ferredoxin oxidoreductase delta subunit